MFLRKADPLSIRPARGQQAKLRCIPDKGISKFTGVSFQNALRFFYLDLLSKQHELPLDFILRETIDVFLLKQCH